MKKVYLFLFAFLSIGFWAVAQNNGGSIKVTMTDQKTKESIPFANVVVYNGKVQVAVGTTDIDGNVIIKPLAPGKYNVKAVYVGYQAQQKNDVEVLNDKTAYVSFPMSNEGGVNLETVVVTEYSIPLIDPDTKSGATTDRASFQAMANKELGSVVSTAAGTYQSDAGKDVNLRGARAGSNGVATSANKDQTIFPRSGASNVYIDGERAIGTQNVPQQAVEQISVVLGGLPAQYGDVNSGIISVTTRGPQPKWFGGVEAISSGIPTGSSHGNSSAKGLDPYGYNFIGASVGGPLLSKKDTAGNKRPIIGFFAGGEIVYQKDPSPWATGIYQVNKDKLAQLEAHPLTYSEENHSFYTSASFLTQNDLYISKVRPNVATSSWRLSPKVDFAITPNLNITLGASFDYNKYHNFVYEYALLNSEHNPQVIENTTRGYLRLTQKFGAQTTSEAEKTQSSVKRAYFSFQAGYQKYKFVQQDEAFKDNYFDYGYVGTFNQYSTPVYALKGTATVNGQTYNNVYAMQGTVDTLLTFQPGKQNALEANYNSDVINYYNSHNQALTNTNQIITANGLLNGVRPANVQNLFYNTGRPYGGYDLRDQRIFRITSNFSADIKNHALTIGVEFDQRDERGFSVTGGSLYGLARTLINQHIDIGALDTTSGTYYAPGTYAVTSAQASGVVGSDNTHGVITYNNKYNVNNMSVFAKNFYDQVLGVHDNSSGGYGQIINIDQYDPSKFNLNQFSPDELLSSGSNFVDAWGYDYTGKRLTSKVSFEDFLNKFHKDKFGDTVHDRLVSAFRPIYMAGYIQDKFDFKDIKFNVGVRVDYFNSNQMVLKDKYLLQDAYTVNDLQNSSSLKSSVNGSIPGSVPTDAVVYTDAGATSIVGYRSGDTWYDASGNIISDPKVIADGGGGQAKPFLKEPGLKTPYSNSAFTAYKPQINVMPRIAFNFPISDVANFFAHYDILTQRPSSFYNRLDPKDYYFLSAVQGGILNNPNLKPERTVDYELGFSQILNEKKNAALKLSAFYREMRNMVQITRVNQAYPASYITYGNIDFATVKGFSAEFQLRRTGGFSFNANYTLQFAEGSGSNANGGYNLVNSSQPNLRVIVPLDFDQRHTFTANFDYRFGAGKDYRGPQYTTTKGDKEQIHQVLQDVGINLVARLGSGTPYSQRYPAIADEETALGTATNQFLSGSLNGSRYPWQFRVDLRIDKNFALKWGKTADGDAKKITNLNIYLQVLNLLDTRNVINVHSYTGSPKDDGYLSSAFGISEINNKYAQGAAYGQSFTTLYNAKLNDGRYYSLPRQIRLGLQFDF